MNQNRGIGHEEVRPGTERLFVVVDPDEISCEDINTINSWSVKVAGL